MGLPLEEVAAHLTEAVTASIRDQNYPETTVGLPLRVIQVEESKGGGSNEWNDIRSSTAESCGETEEDLNVTSASKQWSEEGGIDEEDRLSHVPPMIEELGSDMTTSDYFDQNFRASFYTPHKEVVHRESSVSPTRISDSNSNLSSDSSHTGPHLKKTSSPSLNALQLSRDVMQNTEHLYRLDAGKKPWEMSTTSQREFRYNDDFWSKIRSAPYPHKPTLAIGMEGERHFSPEHRESFRRYTSRDLNANAQPFQSEYTMNSHKYEIPSPKPNKDYATIANEANAKALKMAESARRSSNGSMDSRFSQGTTSQSTYKPYVSTVYSSHSLSRPRTSSLRTGIEGPFYGRITSREHFAPPQMQADSRISSDSRPSLVSKSSYGSRRGPESTSYSRHINGGFILKPPMRYDPSLRIADKIDWM